MTNQIPPQIKSAVIRAQTELVPGYTPLSTADWSTMEKVTEHLKPFAELTDKAQAENACVSQVCNRYQNANI